MNLTDYIYDLESVIERLNLPKLRDHGEYYTCSCISGKHVDKTPSMAIHKDGYFVCFACGYKGPLDRLIKDVTGQSVEDFLSINGLADYAFSRSMSPKPRRKEALSIDQIDHDLVKITDGQFQNVRDSSRAMRYIKHRQIPDYLIEDWKIQFAYYTKLNGTTFRDRLIIPIYNEKGKLISYEGRDITGEQKPKVLYPKGGKVGTLFRFYDLDLSQLVYVVEGLMDLIALRRIGLHNSTCTFGIALSENQKNLLTRIPYLVMIPDADEGGNRMLQQIEDFYGREYTVVRLPINTDPGDLSPNALLTCCENAVKASQEHTIKILRGYGHESSVIDNSLWAESLVSNRNRGSTVSESNQDNRIENSPKRRPTKRRSATKVHKGKRKPVTPSS